MHTISRRGIYKIFEILHFLSSPIFQLGIKAQYNLGNPVLSFYPPGALKDAVARPRIPPLLPCPTTS